MQQKAKNRNTKNQDGYKFMNTSGVCIFGVLDPGCLSRIPDTVDESGIRDGKKSTKIGGGKILLSYCTM
jgi:hypothetical protein